MKRYSKEFKEEALKLSDEIGVKKAAQQLGIAYFTLADWRGIRQNTPPAKPLSAEEQTIRIRIMTTKPLTKGTSCCGSRSCGSSKTGQNREKHGGVTVLFSTLSVDQARRAGKEKANEHPQANRLHRHVCRTGQAHGGAAPADGIVL